MEVGDADGGKGVATGRDVDEEEARESPKRQPWYSLARRGGRFARASKRFCVVRRLVRGRD